MRTKITYTTINGNTFKTIASCQPIEKDVETFMYNNYNMAGIVGYSFRPSVKQSYKKFVNVKVK
jgi:hypothetical protein